MKKIFISCLFLLTCASIVTYKLLPESQTTIPVLYWVTQPNPLRQKQVEMFREWLKENDYPDIDLRVDSINADTTKIIIQGVSGVAGDIIDIDGGFSMPYYNELAILADITESAKEMGFEPNTTYACVESEITENGRQYLYPCGIGMSLYWINKETLEKYGLEIPPARWDFETFERLGKEFVKAANPPGKRQRIFFINDVDYRVMRRSLGLSTFNETLTKCVLDDPRNIQVLKLLYKWTYEDGILPTPAAIASMGTALAEGVSRSNYTAAALRLFLEGNYALFRNGRGAVIRRRLFESKLTQLAVTEPPHGGFPNAFVGVRAAAIYAGSKNKDLAKYFLAFLTSDVYNQGLVVDGAGLPPNPKYVDSDAFRYPPGYPNEWGCHEFFSKAINEIGIAGVYSPFVLHRIAFRIDWDFKESYLSGRISVEDASREMTERINDEIQRNLSERPRLQARYDELCQRQKIIDQYRAEGKKIPAEWIENSFHKKYYAFKGWIE